MTSTSAYRKEKNSLFELQESSRGVRKRSVAATNATAVEAAAIQQSLKRTQKLLQSELARVSAVQQAIQDDEKLLRETMHTHKTLNVSAAKRALTELERAKRYEERVLWMSVGFFFLVVAYVIWSRIVSRIPLLDRVMRLVPLLWEVTMKFIAQIQTKLT